MSGLARAGKGEGWRDGRLGICDRGVEGVRRERSAVVEALRVWCAGYADGKQGGEQVSGNPTKLFTFASRNIENIQRGVEAKLWAVATVSDTAMKSRQTKARRNLIVGSKGLLYCNPRHSFTVPFLVTTPPDLEAVVTDVWPEAWVLPFGIEPLGNFSRSVSKEEAQARWPFLAHRMSFDGYNSVSAAMNFTGTTVFVPLEITEQDWELILSDLASTR